MASNAFGKVFRVTTWGESHGRAVGAVIDGCPAGLKVDEGALQEFVSKRAPGREMTSPRGEPDRVEIWSGLFQGVTTGAPISLIIQNRDSDGSKYDPIKDLLRPGHANFTYLEKYGLFDYFGGGRASARETAARVAAGGIAKQLLKRFSIEVEAQLEQVGPLKEEWKELLLKMMEEGDSLGGVVSFKTGPLPIGLGDPIYDKLEATLASYMMSIPASKGFEMGRGFEAATMRGSDHNDTYGVHDDEVFLKSNHAGGTLGGISTGMPLYGRVAFKPTSSIKKAMSTATVQCQEATFQLPEGSRHDPCVAIRAVAVVEAMVALALVDALLMNRLAKV